MFSGYADPVTTTDGVPTAKAPTAEAAAPGAAGGTPRPQSLMLSFFGIHGLGRPRAVSSGSVIDVFGRAGITEEAVRSTLTRMVNRELLERHRRGRKMYFGLTARAVGVLRDGHDRVWRAGAVNRDWNGRWTLVGFSLPEAWRSERHDLRSRLIWGGFGPLQNGLWVAPSEADVPGLLAGLGLDAQLRVFRGELVAPSDAGQVLAQAFDMPGIAAGYRAFLDRWEDGRAPVEDPLARQLLVHTDWLDLVRRDPHLPAEHLPADWPAVRAEEVFRSHARRCEKPAARLAEQVVDAIELD
jgi:phenylacetic acid degradation operon negative regulatory protein